ncbi:MAG: hypothetical protein EOO24_63300, partial [Comamonadaceae bacterium]
RSVVIATPVRGREAPELESVMGFFNNVLPLPFQVDKTLDFGGFIRYVKNELVAVMSYQQVPFERMATEPEFVNLAQGAGLYQGLFSFQDARERPHDFGGLRHEQVHLLQRGATDDMGLWLRLKCRSAATSAGLPKRPATKRSPSPGWPQCCASNWRSAAWAAMKRCWSRSKTKRRARATSSAESLASAAAGTCWSSSTRQSSQWGASTGR